jgi:hypothetical protein
VVVQALLTKAWPEIVLSTLDGDYVTAFASKLVDSGAVGDPVSYRLLVKGLAERSVLTEQFLKETLAKPPADRLRFDDLVALAEQVKSKESVLLLRRRAAELVKTKEEYLRLVDPSRMRVLTGAELHQLIDETAHRFLQFAPTAEEAVELAGIAGDTPARRQLLELAASKITTLDGYLKFVESSPGEGMRQFVAASLDHLFSFNPGIPELKRLLAEPVITAADPSLRSKILTAALAKAKRRGNYYAVAGLPGWNLGEAARSVSSPVDPETLPSYWPRPCLWVMRKLNLTATVPWAAAR